jgi:hypothetical protein
MNNILQELININKEYIRIISLPIKNFQKVEPLTQLLLELDSINVHDNNFLRKIRKNIINLINNHIDYIELII